MKPSHIATLAVSCVLVGVVLTLLVQTKLRERKCAPKPESKPPTVLNPSAFSGGSQPLPPAVTVPPQGVAAAPARDAAPEAAAPPGSGDRWTPL